jgi:hypothetical protein
MKKIIIAILLFLPLVGFSQVYCVVPTKDIDHNILDSCYQNDWEKVRYSTNGMCVLEPRFNNTSISKYQVKSITKELSDTTKWYSHGLMYYDFFYFDDMNFNQAFAKARNIGLPIFKWQGKLYSTKLKNE